MMPAVVVNKVSKQFRQHQPDRPWTIQEAVARGLRGLRPAQYFWALRDVSFTVRPGRTVGLVGANGSGKSTMLRLIGGVGRPDSGQIQVNGRIGALLDLGAGFHTELTGRENSIVSGILNGLTRQEVLERMGSIVAFAEMERAIDNPVRTYSTGMRMRLAFAVAVHTEPEIMIIDEVLAVGDVAFQRKCLDRIAEFKAAGCSILVVSHEPGAVTELCDDAVWLKAGRLVAEGDARDVVHDYLVQMRSQLTSATPAASGPHKGAPEASPGGDEDQARDVQLMSVRVCDIDRLEIVEVRTGAPVLIEIDFIAVQPVASPIFHVRVAREDGLVCLDLNTEMTDLRDATLQRFGRASLWLDRLDLNSGRYYISVGCHSSGWGHLHHHRHNVCLLTVLGDDTLGAVLNTPHRWELTEGA